MRPLQAVSLSAAATSEIINLARQ